MTQLAETKTIVESTVANLLSSLRTANMASGSTSSNSGFANLLEQVGASVAQIDQNDKKTAYSHYDDARKGKEIVERDETETQERVVEEQRTAPLPAERKEVKHDDKPVKETSSEQTTNEVVETKETSDNDDTQEIASASDDAVMVAKEDEPDDLEEDIEALIAALAPFIGPAPETVVAVKGESTAEAEQAGSLGGVEATEEGLLASLQRLEDLQGEIEATANDGGEEGARAKELNQILKQIAGEISSLKDTMTQETDAQSLTERLAAASQEKVAPMESAQDAPIQDPMVDDAMTLEQPRSPRAQFVQSAHESAQAAEQAAVETQTASAVAVAQSAMTGQGAAEWKTSTGTSSQAGNATQTHLIGLGMKTAGSYDFASELSAARVTKGGATGLPLVAEQVSVQLHKAVKAGVDEITIQLRPGELGKIEVKLSFGDDNSVTGTVVADNQATLTMLQKDSASLERALQEAGLQADSGCLEFSLREESQQQDKTKENGKAQNNGFGRDMQSAGTGEGEEAAQEQIYYLTPGRVNIHV